MNNLKHFLQFFLCSFFILSSSSFSSCQTSIETSNGNDLPIKLFDPYVEDTKVNNELLIPYQKDGLYGISNYEGKVILTPQFKKIKLISFSLPFFWAGDRADMTLRDISGQKILDADNLPVTYHPKNRIKQPTIKIQDIENDEITFQKFYCILNNKVSGRKPLNTSLNNLQGEKFIFLTKNTKPPYQFHEYLNLKKHARRNYQINGNWEDPFVHKPIKVKRDDGSIAYIYKDGKAIDYSKLDLDFYKRNTTDNKLVGGKNLNIKERGKNLSLYKNKDGKFGALDNNGKIILPFEFKHALLLKHGLSNQVINYIIAKKDSAYQIFDKDGSKISDFEWMEAGNNKVQTPFTSTGIGRVYRLKSSDAEYLIDYQLRVIHENSTGQSLVNKSKFILDNISEDIINDYKNSKLADGLSSFVVFNGIKYAHIFDTAGKYIKSIEGKFLYTESFLNDSLKHGEEQFSPLAIGKMKKRNRFFWVRLEDGMKYAED